MVPTLAGIVGSIDVDDWNLLVDDARTAALSPELTADLSEANPSATR
jgi:hypothetical protein